jgi:hypothetical protein
VQRPLVGVDAGGGYEVRMCGDDLQPVTSSHSDSDVDDPDAHLFSPAVATREWA